MERVKKLQQGETQERGNTGHASVDTGFATRTVLLISHDRDFIDNVATQTYVFEGEGKVQEYVSGY